MVTPKWSRVGILNTNLPLMKRNIYHPAIECSCGLHTWPTLLQSVCKYHICLNLSYLLDVAVAPVVPDNHPKSSVLFFVFLYKCLLCASN